MRRGECRQAGLNAATAASESPFVSEQNATQHNLSAACTVVRAVGLTAFFIGPLLHLIEVRTKITSGKTSLLPRGKRLPISFLLAAFLSAGKWAICFAFQWRFARLNKSRNAAKETFTSLVCRHNAMSWEDAVKAMTLGGSRAMIHFTLTRDDR